MPVCATRCKHKSISGLSSTRSESVRVMVVIFVKSHAIPQGFSTTHWHLQVYRFNSALQNTTMLVILFKFKLYLLFRYSDVFYVLNFVEAALEILNVSLGFVISSSHRCVQTRSCHVQFKGSYENHVHARS